MVAGAEVAVPATLVRPPQPELPARPARHDGCCHGVHTGHRSDADSREAHAAERMDSVPFVTPRGEVLDDRDGSRFKVQPTSEVERIELAAFDPERRQYLGPYGDAGNDIAELLQQPVERLEAIAGT